MNKKHEATAEQGKAVGRELLRITTMLGNIAGLQPAALIMGVEYLREAITQANAEIVGFAPSTVETLRAHGAQAARGAAKKARDEARGEGDDLAAWLRGSSAGAASDSGLAASSSLDPKMLSDDEQKKLEDRVKEMLANLDSTKDDEEEA
jgi:hypothetical protein